MKRRLGKLLIAGITTGAMIMTSGVHVGGPNVAAAENPPSPWIDITVNGGRLLQESPAFVHQGRVMVPFRTVSTGMGAQIGWNQAEQTATVSNSSHTARYTVGSLDAVMDDHTVRLDAAPMLREGRVYIPLRYAAEGLGGTITWDNAAKSAAIYPALHPGEAKSATADISKQAITALQHKDFDKLAELAHAQGITFSPYAYVDRKQDITLTKEQLRQGFDHRQVYEWGEYDGTGEPISMNFEEYFNKFVYTSDFANADWIGYNQSRSEGNSINNASAEYPDAVLVEYYFDGIHPDYGGIDWQSLRLVFQQEGNTWVLSGIIHDQWTI
ncbi:copper amine oxidase N-terminal domain-containing protein [Paenibacillus sp. JCM 10914]|uniref:copper amine oxidase N-terminal domain-containing protein n=1 Tax=Paenibacillus sp. JCM 10914 TaxID=1236974 RepID=UPI000562BB27|nr:copper amine oxidase N-terminal domain-containing protein [Paenibacillus sp. JCM 10914]